MQSFFYVKFENLSENEKTFIFYSLFSPKLKLVFTRLTIFVKASFTFLNNVPTKENVFVKQFVGFFINDFSSIFSTIFGTGCVIEFTYTEPAVTLFSSNAVTEFSFGHRFYFSNRKTY